MAARHIAARAGTGDALVRIRTDGRISGAIGAERGFPAAGTANGGLPRSSAVALSRLGKTNAKPRGQ